MVRNTDIGTSVETRAVFGFSKTAATVQRNGTESEEWSGVSLEIRIGVVPVEGFKIPSFSSYNTIF